jgi:hypothetical protein
MGRTGIRISFLASLLVAGAGCGSVKDSGGPIDAGGDAGPDADESGEATVTTKGFVVGQTVGAVVGDIDLISMLPNNMVLATAKTSAGGTATIKVYPGGTVTAVYKRMAPDLGADLVTFVGVKPGDTLEFGNRNIAFSGTSAVIGAQNYSWPTAPAPGVTTYRIATSCTQPGVAAPTLSVAGDERNNCNKTPMDVLYTAVTNTALVNCGSRQNVTFANGANVALGSWQNASTFISNITGLPTSSTQLNVQLSSIIDGGTERFLSGGGFASGVPSGGAFTGNFAWCQIGERTSARLDMFRPGNFFGIRVADSLPSSATSWTVASPVTPPWIEGTFLTSAAKGRVDWVLVPEGTNAADATYVELQFTQRINSTNFTGRWFFALPPDKQSLDFPKLPASFVDLVPSVDFGVFVSRLFVVDVPTVTGYDALKAMGFANIQCPECAVRANEIQRVLMSGQF